MSTFIRVILLLATLGIALDLGYKSFSDLNEINEMKTWKETTGKVLTAHLNVSHGKKGKRTYLATATYSYEVNNRTYTGEKISIYKGHDNVGSFQQDKHRYLTSYMDSGKAISVWVNPEDPSDSVLFRELRPEMLVFEQLFVIVFGGFGIVFLFTGRYFVTRPFSNQPRKRSIPVRGTFIHRGLMALAIFFNAYVAFLLSSVSRVMSPSSFPWYFWTLVYVGVFIILIAFYFYGRFRKFGISELELSPMPAILGDQLLATIKIPATFDVDNGFDVVLQNIHQFTTGHGKRRRIQKNVIWENKQKLKGNFFNASRIRLPLRFSIPEDAKATTYARGDGYYWLLTVTASVSGIDYNAVFDVPVESRV